MTLNRIKHTANRFMKPLQFMLTVLFLIFVFQSSAQNYPVQVSINATGPFYNYLSFYGDQNNHLQLVATLTDFNAPPTNVKLRLKIEGPGYELRTNPNFQGGNSFLLSPGSPVFIQGFDLAPYLTENALIKQPGGFDLSNMPEGFTTICVDIIKDGPSQEVLSTNNCYSFFLQRFQPPMPLMPVCESVLSTEQQVYNFQWTPPIGYVPTINSQLEYVFELYEWNDQSNYSIFQTQQGLIDSQVVIIPNVQINTLINQNDITLQEGMKYIWRVKARLTENGIPVQIFENNGISEPCIFQYGESQSLEEQLTDGLEINLTANGMAERKGRAQWTVTDNTPSEGLSNFNSFIVQYRKAQSGSGNPYSWFEDSVTGSQSDIYQLEPSTTYECRVLGLYGNFIGDTSNTESFTTDAARIYACGDADLPYRSPNYSPLEIAEPGITVEIGQFTMKVTQITSTGTPGRYSGKGIVPIDFLMGAQAKVNFDDILIDDEFVVREGRVDVSTDGVENWLHEQYKQFIDPIYVDGTVDDIYVDTAGGSAWITIDGDSTKYEFDPPDYPIIINDEDGNQYTIYPNGNIEQSTYFNISDDYLSVTAGQVATFEEDPNENFGFDAKAHTQWHEQYEIIELSDSSKYFVANKSLATGESDPVTLVFEDSIPQGSLTYQVGSGNSAQPIQLNGNTATITIPDFSSKGEYALYIYAGNKRVGKLNIYVFDEKEIDVVIVPVANVNLDSTTLNTAINNIFNEANIQVNLSTAAQWNNAEFTSTTLIDLPSDVTNFSKYSEDMRNLRDTYFDSVPEADKSKYYLFVVEGFNGNGSEEGYMVRGKGLGFVTKNTTPQTYAHELGHGAGALAHTWKENGPEEGMTNNLMDYNGGSNLTLAQWEELRKLNLVPSFWDSEEDAMYSSQGVAYYYKEFIDSDGNITGRSYWKRENYVRLYQDWDDSPSYELMSLDQNYVVNYQFSNDSKELLGSSVHDNVVYYNIEMTEDGFNREFHHDEMNINLENHNFPVDYTYTVKRYYRAGQLYAEKVFDWKGIRMNPNSLASSVGDELNIHKQGAEYLSDFLTTGYYFENHRNQADFHKTNEGYVVTVKTIEGEPNYLAAFNPINPSPFVDGNILTEVDILISYSLSRDEITYLLNEYGISRYNNGYDYYLYASNQEWSVKNYAIYSDHSLDPRMGGQVPWFMNLYADILMGIPGAVYGYCTGTNWRTGEQLTGWDHVWNTLEIVPVAGYFGKAFKNGIKTIKIHNKTSGAVFDVAQAAKNVNSKVFSKFGDLKSKGLRIAADVESELFLFANKTGDKILKFVDDGVELMKTYTGSLSSSTWEMSLGNLPVKYGDDFIEQEVKLIKVGDEVSAVVRFVAKSGDELKTFLNGITDLPAGVPYSKDLYRYKTTGAPYSVTNINPNMNPSVNRFKTGLYATTSKNGNLIEVNAYGGTTGKTQYEISNVQIENLLDLTDEATIQKLGTSFEQMKFRNPNNSVAYEFTHVVADWAKSKGYSGVRFYGAHGEDEVYENLLIFEQYTVNNAIINSSIDPVPW